MLVPRRTVPSLLVASRPGRFRRVWGRNRRWIRIRQCRLDSARPFEVFHPWYGRGGVFGGRNGFGNINIVRNTNITNIYRNARVTNGVTAVSANDFQRGNFRDHVAVNSGQLQQASLVRGALPVTPGSANLRFTDRAASASTPRGDLGNQRFFSRSSVGTGAPQRTSFAQQQATVRSAIEGRSATGAAGYGSTASGSNNATSGWQRFGSPQGGSQRYAPPASQGGSAQGLYGVGSSVNGSSRSLQVAPPIVHQRDYAPSNNNGGSYTRGGSQFGAPTYRSAPSAPAYRTAPQTQSAPSYRSPPAPASHSGGGNSGGGHASSGGAGHSGGHR